MWGQPNRMPAQYLGVMQQHTPEDALPVSMRQWLADLTRAAGEDTRWGKGTSRVLDVLARDAAFASYATIGELAARADVHPSSVTRLAQALGYAGWPAFRVDVRAVYLDGLGPQEHVREPIIDPISAVIAADVHSVSELQNPLRVAQIAGIAQALKAAHRVVVSGSGLAAAPASIIGYVSLLAGRDVRVALGSATSQAAEVARLDQGDVLVLVNVWRTTSLLYSLAQLARERGITVCLLTDLVGSRLEQFCDHVLVASTDNPSGVPSVAALSSAALAIMSASGLEDERAHIRGVERAWNSLDLMDAHD